MSKPVKIAADSTCDLGDELSRRFGVTLFPLHVVSEGKTREDGVDIFPDDIYRTYREKGVLPKTAAANISEYLAFFESLTADGSEVVFFTLGGALSSTCQNAKIAAADCDGVYVVDSRNLSSGSALVVLEAVERAAAGMDAATIAEETEALTAKSHASFVLNDLEFLHKGGRCSALAMLGANLLKLKPCIEVNNADGSMTVGKKYRGSLDGALKQYVQDKLEGRTDLRLDRIFLTHSGISDERIALVKQEIEKYQSFDEILINRAGCTISAHCGPDTLGILFMTR